MYLGRTYDTPGVSTSRIAKLREAGGRECPGCRALAYADDRYCACCGTRLDEACAACGSPITHPVANYCSQCGVPVDARRRD
jgi:predicted amidophosphoribosyltransferase